MKDSSKKLSKERPLGFQVSQPAPLNQDFLTVTVIPCGREDGKNTYNEDELPYEIKLKKKCNRKL
jgi:hypothetical protein